MTQPTPLFPPKPQPTRRRSRRTLLWAAPVLLCAAGLLAALSLNGCAAIGAAPDSARQAQIRQSPQWHGDHFDNPQGIWTDVSGALAQAVFGPSPDHTTPDAPLPVVHDTAASFAQAPASGLRVTWFGHSYSLLEIDGAKVLIDPFDGQRASPFNWIGPQRWYPSPVALKDLPKIDAVVISHDHYDHLDQAAIVAMKDWSNIFVVPLGVGAHLLRWGIPPNRIVELDWWQSAHLGGLEIVATPARHASGRTSPGSNQTLWAGYAIIGARHRAWYSGDTGFHNELGRIGERLGPFDVTLIEAGQYDAKWPDLHLGPEQAVEAHRLVRGKYMIPVHWALLKLANHAWTEPAERVLAAARCSGVPLLLPRPGESIEPSAGAGSTPWWPHIAWQTAATQPVLATAHGAPSERVELAPCTRQGS